MNFDNPFAADPESGPSSLYAAADPNNEQREEEEQQEEEEACEVGAEAEEEEEAPPAESQGDSNALAPEPGTVKEEVEAGTDVETGTKVETGTEVPEAFGETGETTTAPTNKKAGKKRNREVSEEGDDSDAQSKAKQRTEAIAPVSQPASAKEAPTVSAPHLGTSAEEGAVAQAEIANLQAALGAERSRATELEQNISELRHSLELVEQEKSTLQRRIAARDDSLKEQLEKNNATVVLNDLKKKKLEAAMGSFRSEQLQEDLRDALVGLERAERDALQLHLENDLLQSQLEGVQEQGRLLRAVLHHGISQAASNASTGATDHVVVSAVCPIAKETAQSISEETDTLLRSLRAAIHKINEAALAAAGTTPLKDVLAELSEGVATVCEENMRMAKRQAALQGQVDVAERVICEYAMALESAESNAAAKNVPLLLQSAMLQSALSVDSRKVADAIAPYVAEVNKLNKQIAVLQAALRAALEGVPAANKEKLAQQAVGGFVQELRLECARLERDNATLAQQVALLKEACTSTTDGLLACVPSTSSAAAPLVGNVGCDSDIAFVQLKLMSDACSRWRLRTKVTLDCLLQVGAESCMKTLVDASAEAELLYLRQSNAMLDAALDRMSREYGALQGGFDSVTHALLAMANCPNSNLHGVEAACNSLSELSRKASATAMQNTEESLNALRREYRAQREAISAPFEKNHAILAQVLSTLRGVIVMQDELIVERILPCGASSGATTQLSSILIGDDNQQVADPLRAMAQEAWRLSAAVVQDSPARGKRGPLLTALESQEGSVAREWTQRLDELVSLYHKDYSAEVRRLYELTEVFRSLPQKEATANMLAAQKRVEELEVEAASARGALQEAEQRLQATTSDLAAQKRNHEEALAARQRASEEAVARATRDKQEALKDRDGQIQALRDDLDRLNAELEEHRNQQAQHSELVQAEPETADESTEPPADQSAEPPADESAEPPADDEHSAAVAPPAEGGTEPNVAVEEAEASVAQQDPFQSPFTFS